MLQDVCQSNGWHWRERRVAEASVHELSGDVMRALKDPRDAARRHFWGLGNSTGNRRNDGSVTPGLQKASFLQMLAAVGMTFLRREASSPSP